MSCKNFLDLLPKASSSVKSYADQPTRLLLGTSLMKFSLYFYAKVLKTLLYRLNLDKLLNRHFEIDVKWIKLFSTKLKSGLYKISMKELIKNLRCISWILIYKRILNHFTFLFSYLSGANWWSLSILAYILCKLLPSHWRVFFTHLWCLKSHKLTTDAVSLLR